MRASQRISGTVAVALAATGAAFGLAPTAQAAPGVCDGVARCTVVTHVDVNGDGRQDDVGVARRGQDGDARGRAIVRVRTGPRHIDQIRWRTQGWSGKLWQGSAFLDGRRGRELVVGRTMGAHTEFFRAVTWRHGDLVILDAPGRDHDWVADGAVNYTFGWQQLRSDPAGTLRRRQAVRSETGSTFRGQVDRFDWTGSGWQRVAHHARNISEDTAFRWGGFHVPGLRRY